jgi:hypothetical protein
MIKPTVGSRHGLLTLQRRGMVLVVVMDVGGCAAGAADETLLRQRLRVDADHLQAGRNGWRHAWPVRVAGGASSLLQACVQGAEVGVVGGGRWHGARGMHVWVLVQRVRGPG